MHLSSGCLNPWFGFHQLLDFFLALALKFSGNTINPRNCEQSVSACTGATWDGGMCPSHGMGEIGVEWRRCKIHSNPNHSLNV